MLYYSPASRNRESRPTQSARPGVLWNRKLQNPTHDTQRDVMNPLADTVYRRLFLAQVTALLGTGLATVALALLAWDLAEGNAGAVLGTALAIKMIAYVGVTPLITGLTRNLPRRPLLVSLDCARAACVGCMPFVDAVWQVYVLIVVLNACSAGFTPTFQATIPEVLPDELTYTRALSLSRLAYDLESLLSPGLAAAALLVISYDALFAGNAVAFLLSAALVLSVTLPHRKPADTARPGFIEATTSGIRTYLRTPRLLGLLALSLAVAAASAMVIVNTVVYVRDALGGSQVDTALALGAYGAGSMTAALLLPRVIDRTGDRPLMLVGAVLLAAALIVGISGLTFPALLVTWLVLGTGASLVQTPAGRLLTRSANAETRAPLFAAQFTLSHACWLITYPLAGWGSATLGLDATFGVLGAIAAASAVAAAAAWPAGDPVELEHTHPATTHTHPHVHDAHHPHTHAPGADHHAHEHSHPEITHTHAYIIDQDHPVWPDPNRAS